MRTFFTVASWVIVGIACALVVGLGVELISHSDGLSVTLGGREITFLEPSWFWLAAITPIFFGLIFISLTDLSRAQQVLQAAFRSLVVIGLAVALGRPAWTTSDNKVATVVLVDVSDSVSDKQLEAARAWVGQLEAARAPGDKLDLITFAEHPRLVRGDDLAIERHQGAGAGTDIQAAMQLAYGLYPPDHVQRMVIISDGNQTRGDALVEAYRAQEFDVKVSWQSFPQDRVQEIRVAGMTLPDEVKQGAPFKITAEVWSTHEEEVTLALRQDEFPNPLEPSRKVKLHEGVNKIDFKSKVDRAGFATYKLRLVDPKGDTEKGNNSAVMSTPVKGKPAVLYVEGGLLREPGSASYLKRALEAQNMTVDVRNPRGLPSSAKEMEKFDLVMVSDVP
ncbi:MAG TPA: VWA domain-containing protein, partial [Kofleriaceae bacterium]|nr:VWA domain-containing protein [Kofleriaceae bacterium]